MKQFYTIVLGIAILALASCNGRNEQNKSQDAASTPPPKVDAPVFNADSAYADVGMVASFGPRVPGTPAQNKCAAWMEERLKKVCDTVYRQSVQVTTGDKKSLPCINLIGVIHPAAKKRILLLTHWDSRPWADMDTKDKEKPIIAADDGGSGVGVLIEVAKEIKAKGLSADLGVDILLTDAEDYGKSEWGEKSYCLGTQYWSKNPHVPGYNADFGILLDMVGGKGAQFPMEGLSMRDAGDVQKMVWQAAGNAGYSSYFPYVNGPAITDDHVPVNKLARIKTVDIINLTTNPEKPFAAHWHTHADVMDVIDRNTLKAVGQTLLEVIYEHAPAQ